ncbi:hypothetical protein PVAP13_9NG330700 [Panicum virgatum]|uniref:Uncharacterized protein n=1 Tax=Panicum virgatum TaxID=38727 RepID=A0A8T0MSJ4_PANVG|nr:hypothetical protein PVAP13_9NG330700 [Panicum virgatum]
MPNKKCLVCTGPDVWNGPNGSSGVICVCCLKRRESRAAKEGWEHIDNLDRLPQTLRASVAVTSSVSWPLPPGLGVHAQRSMAPPLRASPWPARHRGRRPVKRSGLER